jgi:hypothetical protein
VWILSQKRILLLVTAVHKSSRWRPCRMIDGRRPGSNLFISCRNCLCVSVIASMSGPRVVRSESGSGMGTGKGQYQDLRGWTGDWLAYLKGGSSGSCGSSSIWLWKGRQTCWIGKTRAKWSERLMVECPLLTLLPFLTPSPQTPSTTTLFRPAKSLERTTTKRRWRGGVVCRSDASV